MLILFRMPLLQAFTVLFIFKECTDVPVSTPIKRKSDFLCTIVSAVSCFSRLGMSSRGLSSGAFAPTTGASKSHVKCQIYAPGRAFFRCYSRDTPQQNGKSEQFGREAKDRTQTMTLNNSTQSKYLPEALMYSTLIRNCIPTNHQPDTSWFAFYGVRLDLMFSDFKCLAIGFRSRAFDVHRR